MKLELTQVMTTEMDVHHVRCLILDGPHAGEYMTIETNDAGLLEMYLLSEQPTSH